MDWSEARTVLRETKTPSGYELSLLRREDVLVVIESLREWYGDLDVSAEACHLTPEFYYEHAVLADVTEDRPILPVVALHEGGVVALITFEKDSSQTLTCRIGVIAPGHRGPALATLGPLLLEKIGRPVERPARSADERRIRISIWRVWPPIVEKM